MSTDKGRLTYNEIELEIVHTHRITREDVYENGDYIGVKHTFDVTGVYNPRAMAFLQAVPGAGGPSRPNPTAGTVPPTTDIAIRDWLSQPRRTLVYTNGATEMLRSPAPLPAGILLGDDSAVNIPGKAPNPTTPICDVTGGPFPLKPAEILHLWGEKTFIIRFAVSTVINESYRNTTKPCTLLSNRWEASTEYDDCAFETRIYRGRALFRLDLLTSRLASDNTRQMVADDLRDYFGVFQLSPGFQRESVRVRQTPLGDACDYEFRDVQQAETLTDRRAMKLEAIWDSGVNSVGLEEVLTTGAFDALDIFRRFDVKNPLASFGDLIPFAQKKLGQLPQTYETLVVTARGHQGSIRAALAGVCYKTAASLIGVFSKKAGLGNTVFPALKANVRKDAMGKYVQLSVIFKRGPLQTQAAGIPFTAVPLDDGITNVTTNTPGVQPPYPGDGGVRGTSLEALVWQALTNVPYRPPTRPPTPLAALLNQGP